MKISCSTIREVKGKASGAIILGISEAQKNLQSYVNLLDPKLLQKVDRWIFSGEASPKKNEIFSFDIEDGSAKKLYVVVLPKSPSLEHLRQACARVIDYVSSQKHEEARLLADSFKVKDIPLSDIVEALTEGICLSLYRYDRFKKKDDKKPKIESVQLIFEKSEDFKKLHKTIEVAQVIAESTNFTRDLVNTPANELTPLVLSEIAESMAKDSHISFEVFGKAELQKMKLDGILAVAQGSAQEPQLIVLEYGNKKALVDFAFVGKGVTFDSGGLSIKHSDGMEKMKYDMAGGASVIGLLKTIARLELNQHVVGIIPAVENLPSGTASRPGDVIWMGSGKSVEIVSTDAEGRLVVGDGLFYAQQYKPKFVVDLATLTGACVVALGNLAIGLLGNHPMLIQKIKEAGEATGERVWELPLWDEYYDQIKSDIAEIKNIGGKGAGTITGAMFLKQFVNYPWAHLDIAGTAWADDKKPYCPKGATGVGVRLLTKMLRDWNK